MDELTKIPEEQAVSMIPQMIQQMMGPIVETMTKLLEHNAQALEQLAGTQKVQNDRLEALEKQIRLNTPVTAQQVKYLNEAIKAHGRELLAKRNIEDAAAVKKLGNAIRKSVLARYGIGSMREIPKHEYPVAMNQIGMWNDVLTVLDCVREARKRVEANSESGEQAACLDGGETISCTNHQLH